MVSSVFEDIIPDLGVISELSNNLKQTFQAGVDALYNKCKSCGATPGSKTPTAISTAISAIHTNRYSAGRTQGQNDVKGSPNSYGLYTAAQYTANYNAGYNAGIANGDVKHQVKAIAQITTHPNDSNWRLIKISLYKDNILIAEETTTVVNSQELQATISTNAIAI